MLRLKLFSSSLKRARLLIAPRLRCSFQYQQDASQTELAATGSRWASTPIFVLDRPDKYSPTVQHTWGPRPSAVQRPELVAGIYLFA